MILEEDLINELRKFHPLPYPSPSVAKSSPRQALGLSLSKAAESKGEDMGGGDDLYQLDIVQIPCNTKKLPNQIQALDIYGVDLMGTKLIGGST